MSSHKCSHVSDNKVIPADKSCANTIKCDESIADTDFFDVLDLACEFADAGPHAKCILDDDKTKIVEISFMPGQKLAPHQSPAHVVVSCVVGKVKFTLKGKDIWLEPGQLIYMKPGDIHSVKCPCGNCTANPTNSILQLILSK